MTPEALVIIFIRVILDLVGEEKAKAMLSQEAINRANAAADALENARGLE